jgi:hypothetical protein
MDGLERNANDRDDNARDASSQDAPPLVHKGYNKGGSNVEEQPKLPKHKP